MVVVLEASSYLRKMSKQNVRYTHEVNVGQCEARFALLRSSMRELHIGQRPPSFLTDIQDPFLSLRPEVSKFNFNFLLLIARRWASLEGGESPANGSKKALWVMTGRKELADDRGSALSLRFSPPELVGRPN